MTKLLTRDESIRKAEVVGTNRRARRDLAKHKSGCLICRQAIKKGESIVWADGMSCHEACAAAHNAHVDNLRDAEQEERVKASGLEVVHTEDLFRLLGSR